MRPATGAPQRAREQARRIPVKTLAGGIQAEHGIAEELEPVKWFLWRPGSAWWRGGVVQRVVGGGRQAAMGWRRQSTGLGWKEQELLRGYLRVLRASALCPRASVGKLTLGHQNFAAGPHRPPQLF